ncbi:MAG: hypothetical protein WAK39_24930, partial [Pseudolabrys sp.]
LSNPLDKARLIQMAQDFLSMAKKKTGFSEHGRKRRAVDERVTFKMFDDSVEPTRESGRWRQTPAATIPF